MPDECHLAFPREPTEPHQEQLIGELGSLLQLADRRRRVSVRQMAPDRSGSLTDFSLHGASPRRQRARRTARSSAPRPKPARRPRCPDHFSRRSVVLPSPPAPSTAGSGVTPEGARSLPRHKSLSDGTLRHAPATVPPTACPPGDTLSAVFAWKLPNFRWLSDHLVQPLRREGEIVDRAGAAGARVHPVSSRRCPASAAAARRLTRRNVSGLTAIESIPASTRKRARGGARPRWRSGSASSPPRRPRRRGPPSAPSPHPPPA